MSRGMALDITYLDVADELMSVLANKVELVANAAARDEGAGAGSVDGGSSKGGGDGTKEGEESERKLHLYD